MSKSNNDLKSQSTEWHVTQATELQKIRASQRHLIYNVFSYLLISIIEYSLASISKSQVLRADAFNNLSGIISTFLLIMGLHIASDIDDDDIIGAPLAIGDYRKDMLSDQRTQFVRWRYQTIFSLVTAVIMVMISLNVIMHGIKALATPNDRVIPQPVALIGAGIASVILIIVWLMNRHAGHKFKNAALLASSQDSLSDALTSIGTSIAIAGALLFHITWLDGTASIIVGIFILYSGLKIFYDSSLNLTDYFNPHAEYKYRSAILQIKQIQQIIELKAHYNGDVVTLETTVVVDGNMTVFQTSKLAKAIKKMLNQQFGIIDATIVFVTDVDDTKKHLC